MDERLAEHPSSHQCSKKLIVVLEQDEQIGTRFVQLIRQETAYQGILARNLSEVRTILGHLKCDLGLILLMNDTFPAEDPAQLYLLPADIEPKDVLSLTFLSWTYNYWDTRDVSSIVKAVNLLLAVRDGNGPAGGPALFGPDGKRT